MYGVVLVVRDRAAIFTHNQPTKVLSSDAKRSGPSLRFVSSRHLKMFAGATLSSCPGRQASVGTAAIFRTKAAAAIAIFDRIPSHEHGEGARDESDQTEYGGDNCERLEHSLDVAFRRRLVHLGHVVGDMPVPRTQLDQPGDCAGGDAERRHEHAPRPGGTFACATLLTTTASARRGWALRREQKRIVAPSCNQLMAVLLCRTCAILGIATINII